MHLALGSECFWVLNLTAVRDSNLEKRRKRECDGVSVGDPHRPKARPLASSSSSTDVELGVEFDGASAVASSDAQAAKVQAVGQRCPRGESPRRTER